jgi:hypothetical protein
MIESNGHFVVQMKAVWSSASRTETCLSKRVLSFNIVTSRDTRRLFMAELVAFSACAAFIVVDGSRSKPSMNRDMSKRRQNAERRQVQPEILGLNFVFDGVLTSVAINFKQALSF